MLRITIVNSSILLIFRYLVFIIGAVLHKNHTAKHVEKSVKYIQRKMY